MNKLILTVGLPQSGKSTWARSTEYPIVNPDAIRLAIHGQSFVDLAEPFVWATAKVMVRALFGAGHTTVILDATNTTRKRRDDWKSSDWVREYRICTTSVAVCKERATQTYRQELIEVIDQMHEQFEPIESDEIEVITWTQN